MTFIPSHRFKRAPVQTGLELFVEEHLGSYRGKRLGLLANQASVDHAYRHALELLDSALKDHVKVLFSPQHGWAGEKQDNMVESLDAKTGDGRPIYSLYGESRAPTLEMLSEIDALLIDLPDVGTRVYTFAQTMSLCLEVASKAHIEVVVLDRPNPISGAEREGNLLDDDCVSFVGFHPIPMRHGLTLGELALFVNSRLKDPAALTIVPVKGWKREMYFNDTDLNWVLPSPNLPNPVSAWLYPGQVLWEGTNVSEARGTTAPFHVVGAPFMKATTIARELEGFKLPGVVFRPTSFQPTFNKWAGELCQGVQIHPQDRSYKPLLTSLTILQIVLKLHPDSFRLKDPPYEYEWNRRPIDLILGRKSIFDDLSVGAAAFDIWRSFAAELGEFERQVKDILLYR
ncbi:MAG: DUF1343 domain-containing protein [Deltaproteobacteria bacterium]|jgi:uncharacterized protein YbbC (DUF1343 family)|nr:DUF1343 domain-containing protein [Deltaproteobacteria bacterium]